LTEEVFIRSLHKGGRSLSELRQFYRSISGKGAEPLEPGDPCYVPLLEDSPEKDPILALWRRIDLVESESVHLLTGFRGNGKSTQLKRLKKLLEMHSKSKCKVFLVDMLDYILMTKPITLSDFILYLLEALSSAAEKPTGISGLSSYVKNCWERFINFLHTEITLDEATLNLSPAKFRLKLKTDQLFREQIEHHFKGRPTKFVEEAQNFVQKFVSNIRKQSVNPDLKVVLLVDSFEQLRGLRENALKVYDSVVELFSGQATSLSFPMMHVVYTIPPYLPVLAPNLGRTLGGNPVTQWPNIHVMKKEGAPDKNGLELMECIIERRFPAWKQFIPRELMEKFAWYSGGDIRDFFRLLRESAISLMNARENNSNAILDNQIADRVIQELKNEYLPIAEEDARWLAKIYNSKDVSLDQLALLPHLARFFDSNRIMNYMNGKSWYDVHPLLVEEIKRISARKD